MLNETFQSQSAGWLRNQGVHWRTQYFVSQTNMLELDVVSWCPFWQGSASLAVLPCWLSLSSSQGRSQHHPEKNPKIQHLTSPSASCLQNLTDHCGSRHRVPLGTIFTSFSWNQPMASRLWHVAEGTGEHRVLFPWCFAHTPAWGVPCRQDFLELQSNPEMQPVRDSNLD